MKEITKVSYTFFWLECDLIFFWHPRWVPGASHRSLKIARLSGQISHSKILPLLKACFQGMLIGQIGIYSRINFQVISKKEIYPPGSRVREIFQMPAIIKSPPTTICLDIRNRATIYVKS